MIIKKSHEGLLRKYTRTPKGKRIKVQLLKKLSHSNNPKIRKQANFALVARRWKHR